MEKKWKEEAKEHEYRTHGHGQWGRLTVRLEEDEQ